MGESTSPAGAGRRDAPPAHLSEPVARAVAARREALHAAAVHLDGELGALEAQVTPDVERLRSALHAMRAALRAHNEGADAPDGPLHDIVTTAPWLANRAARQRDDHHELLLRASELVDRVDAGEVPSAVMADARQLMAQVHAHRHRATTLLQDAYMADIAEGD